MLNNLIKYNLINEYKYNLINVSQIITHFERCTWDTKAGVWRNCIFNWMLNQVCILIVCLNNYLLHSAWYLYVSINKNYFFENGWVIYILEMCSLLKTENNSFWVNFNYVREKNVSSRIWVDFRQPKLGSLQILYALKLASLSWQKWTQAREVAFSLKNEWN